MLNYTLFAEKLAELRAAHRNAHEKREANRIKAVVLLATGWTAEQVAEVLASRSQLQGQVVVGFVHTTCPLRYALYLWDEPLGGDFYTVAKLTKRIDPKIRLYANRFGEGPSDFMRFKELIDIWSPSITQGEDHPDWLKTVEGFGKQIWTYDTEGPGRANKPYGYYRLLSWKAFQQKKSGTGFWVYAEDESYPSWNDGQKPNGYYDMIYGSARGPVDTLGEQLIPSRRWEAWREGVEDYEYLYQAQQNITALKNQDLEKASTFQSMLDEEVDKVLSRPDHPETVQQARKIISQILTGK